MYILQCRKSRHRTRSFRMAEENTFPRTRAQSFYVRDDNDIIGFRPVHDIIGIRFQENHNNSIKNRNVVMNPQ